MSEDILDRALRRTGILLALALCWGAAAGMAYALAPDMRRRIAGIAFAGLFVGVRWWRELRCDIEKGAEQVAGDAAWNERIAAEHAAGVRLTAMQPDVTVISDGRGFADR